MFMHLHTKFMKRNNTFHIRRILENPSVTVRRRLNSKWRAHERPTAKSRSTNQRCEILCCQPCSLKVRFPSLHPWFLRVNRYLKVKLSQMKTIYVLILSLQAASRRWQIYANNIGMLAAHKKWVFHTSRIDFSIVQSL